MWVNGKILEPLKSFNGFFRGPDPTEDEYEHFCSSMKGKPVYMNHEEEKGVIGKVLEVRKLSHGDVVATIYIDDSLPLTNGLMEKMTRGEINGLSFSQEGDNTLLEKGARYYKIRPTEISLVENGGVPDSRVISFGNEHVTFLSQSGVSRVFPQFKQNMSTEAAATQDNTVTETPVAAEPTKVEEERMVKQARVSVEKDIPEKLAHEIPDEEKIRMFDELRNKAREDIANQLIKSIQQLETLSADMPDTIDSASLQTLKNQSVKNVANPFDKEEFPVAVKIAASAAAAYSQVKAKNAELEAQLAEQKKLNAPPEAGKMDKAENRFAPAEKNSNLKAIQEQMIKAMGSSMQTQAPVLGATALTDEQKKNFSSLLQ